MQSGPLKALEFDQIVEAVCRFAQTPPGVARLAALQPETDANAVKAALAATAEAARYVSGAGDVALRAPADLDGTLDALAVEGRALEAEQLLALATFFASIEATTGPIRRQRGGFPLLAAIADAAASFEREVAEIRRKIDPSGAVVDDASPELRIVRERLRKARTRLRGTLESYLRGKDTSKYLQQQIVTDRNGRYVLVVRSEHRTAIPGIVHGSSGSGASLFLEPLSTVEINNDIVALEQQEAEEVRRILLALADALRRRGSDVQRTIDAATRIDVLQAKARYGHSMQGIAPLISSDGRLELRAAKHPLLLERAANERPASEPPAVSRRAPASEAASKVEWAADPTERSALGGVQGSPAFNSGRGGAGGAKPPGLHDVVPVDVLLIPPVHVLVITGPNTGGKTVALKTAGLLPLMAQAGLLIPAADGTQVPVFRTVFADIGDEQSIAESLSTFSGHIANIVGMEAALELPALVLLDEAGTGTDPNEGGALATAIIDHFRRRGATIVATTHFDALKTYASTTDGVASAGFGFDPNTFAPTYRLTYGSPGSSLAIEIAARLGLSPTIIQQARAQRSEREVQLSEHLAKIDREMQALEHERRLVARERQMLQEASSRLQGREQDLRDREETFRKRLDQRLEERLRDARKEIDAIVDALKAKTSSIAAEAERRAARLVPTGDIGAARADARASLEAIGGRLREGTAPTPMPSAPPDGREPAVGDRVAVGPLGLEGIVQSLHDGAAEVDVRGKRLRARVEELRVISPAAAAAASSPARVRVNIEMAPRDHVVTELNVIGSTSDEALSKVERFLDDALLAELRSVRIVHGYGTGQLRRSIAEFLRVHPFVANFGPAPDNQGGGGVTVVELKD
jgi:DNA mismatch repair protein MutS2